MNKIHSNSKLVVVVKEGIGGFVPFECCACGLLMRSREDVFSYQKYQCCNECVDDVVFPNKINWDAGWRPSKNEVLKIKNKRLEIPSYIMII